MFDSKRSRGLAVSAVSALTISGLTFISSPALAAPSDAVIMLSQLGGKASVRPDGSDTTPQYVDLVAVRRDQDATISFEVNADPAAGDTTAGWTAIAAAPTMTGDFAKASWDALSQVGNTVSLRAVATSEDGTAYSTVTGVAVTGKPGETPAPHSVSVFNSTTGYFQQPYADSSHTASRLVVNGSSSATEGTVDLSWWRSSDGTFQGSTDAALSPGTAKISPNDSSTRYNIGLFREVLDITGYDAEAADNVLAVRGFRDSDEVTPIEVYEQELGAISATAPDEANSRKVTVDVRVTDTDSEASVVGAEVRRLSDGALVGYTDRDGFVNAQQTAGTTETYYANTTDSDGYEDGVDVISQAVTAPEFTPTASDVVPVLADGDYFDDDEYENGDIALQLVDQDGKPIATADQSISYALSEDGSTPPESTVASADAAGRITVPFDPAGPDGKYVLTYNAPDINDGENGGTTHFTSGDATLALTPDVTGGSVASGGQITYTGNLSLGEVPLAGRNVDLTYARGTEAAPGTEADAGIVVGDTRVLTTTVTTDEDGEFTVTIADPTKTGRPAETGGILTATAPASKETASATTTFIAGPVISDPEVPVIPGPVLPTPPSVTPPKTPATVKLALTGSSNGRAADKLKVSGTTTAAGQRIRVFAKVGRGAWKLVTTKRLDSTGRASLQLKDRNGRNVTTYRVQLDASNAVASSTSNSKRVR